MVKKSKKWELYEVSGDSVKRKNKNCPRCGSGIFLGAHANRLACGKCGYTEIQNVPQKPATETPK